MVHLDRLLRDAPSNHGIRLAAGMTANERHRLESVERTEDSALRHAADARKFGCRERGAVPAQEFPRLHRADAFESLNKAGRADID